MHCCSIIHLNIFSTVGGLSAYSLDTACEKLHHGQSQLEDEQCATEIKPSGAFPAPDVLWVSSWRTTAVDEDSSDWEGGSSDQPSEPETESLTGEGDSHPKSLRDDHGHEADWETGSESEVDMYIGEEEFVQEKWLKTDKDYEGGDEEEDEEQDSSLSTEYLCALRGLFPLLQKGQLMNDASWGSEAELEYLRDGESLHSCTVTFLRL